MSMAFNLYILAKTFGDMYNISVLKSVQIVNPQQSPSTETDFVKQMKSTEQLLTVVKQFFFYFDFQLLRINLEAHLQYGYLCLEQMIPNALCFINRSRKGFFFF